MNASQLLAMATRTARQRAGRVVARMYARLRAGFAVFVYFMLGLSPAMADDIDVYTKAVAAGGGGASVILFHIDTSKSMDYDFFEKEANNRQDCDPTCDASALPLSLLDKRFFILSDAMRGQITSLGGNFKVGIVGQNGTSGGVVLAEALALSSGITPPAAPPPLVGGVLEKPITDARDDVDQPASNQPIDSGNWSLNLGQTYGSGGWGYISTLPFTAQWTNSAGSVLPGTGLGDYPTSYTDVWPGTAGNIMFYYEHKSTNDAQTFYLSSATQDTVLYVLQWGYNPATNSWNYWNIKTGPQPSPGDDTGVAQKVCVDDAMDWSLTADGTQCTIKCRPQSPQPPCAGKNETLYKPFVLSGANTNSYVSVTGLQPSTWYMVIAATKTANKSGQFQLNLQYPDRGRYYGYRGAWSGASVTNRTGLRFRALDIPRNATINNAYLQFQAYNYWQAQVPVDLRVGIDESMAPASLSLVNLFDASRSYRWGDYQTVPSWENTDFALNWWEYYKRGPDQRLNVTSILQQQINSADWCGGDVLMVVQGDGGAYADGRMRQAFSNEEALNYRSWGYPDFYPPSLVVDWSPGAAVPGACSQMPEKTYGIGTSTEDITQLPNGSVLLDNTYLSVGASHKTGLRFALVDIPKGAEIETVRLVLTAEATGSPSEIRIQGINEGLTKPFGAAVSELDERELIGGGAPVVFTPASWVAGNSYSFTSPELKALVQGMVNSAGWEYDGTLGFVLTASGSELRMRSWERTLSGVDEVSPGQFGQYSPRLLIKLKAGTALPGGKTHRRLLVETMQNHAPSGYTAIAGSYLHLANYVKGRTALPPPVMQSGSCANNVAILVTDVFENANTYAGFDAQVGTVTGSNNCGGNNKEAWPCLFAMLDAMYEPELAGDAGKSSDGQYYSMRTYSIGMGPLAQTGGGQLRASANKGGGKFFAAKNAAELIAYFKEIVKTVADTGATIAAPGVAVNALNKFEHLDELYYSLFKPSIQADWEGNLKRYRLKAGQIVDVTNRLAVENGESLFKDGSDGTYAARSWWSPDEDGATITVGGSASKLTEPDTRKVYTWLGAYGTSLNSALIDENPQDGQGSEALDPRNEFLTPDMLGVPDSVTDEAVAWARKEQAVAYLRGGTNTVARRVFGAAIHASPTLVTYGVDEPEGDEVAAGENTVFMGDNNGILHMIDTGGPSSDDTTINLANTGGRELFAFIPQELLKNGDPLAFVKPSVLGGQYIYGLDATWIPWKFDPAGDGVSPADGDHVYLYGGMRRGGSNIYALDVTSVRRTAATVAPRLLWAIEGGKSGTAYANMGQTWSDPSPRWIRWGGERRRVIFFGGGYDEAVHDNTQGFTATPHKGRQVYMVDAITGALLWWASSEAGASTVVPDMKYSITAAPMTMDRNGNGVVDGMYIVDLAGQVIRFDFDEGANSAATFARGNTATVVAKLGATAAGASTTTDNRRFYDAPAIAFVRSAIGGDLMIGLVSGYREQPTDTATLEIGMMFRDVGAWNIVPPSRPLITLADLIDVTNDNELTPEQMSAPGWYVRLGQGTPGEKGIGSPVFFNFALLFTTFVPFGASTASACTPDVGYSRLWGLNALTAGGIVNSELDNVPDNQRYLDQAMPGLGSTIQLLYMGGELTLVSGTLAMTTEDFERDDSNLLDAAIFGNIRRTRWFQMNE